MRYALLVLVFVTLVGPFLWQLSLSFKGAGDDLYTRPPQLLPSDPTFGNYQEVVDKIGRAHV